MRNFVYAPHLQRVIFGIGCVAALPEEMAKMGGTKALVLCTPQQRGDADHAAALLGTACAYVFDRAAMHVPAALAREASALASRLGVDCVVAVGGGSTMGLAKAIALETSLPILAVPTTYAGSEVTAIYGLTEGGMKKTGKDARVLPRTVLYDAELTHGLPKGISATSGINAIAHAAEGLYASDGNPVMDLMALEGIAALARALPILVNGDAAETTEARSQALYGAWLCGTVLGNVGMALHHKLCHTLGGSFALPHAETHTVVLPHALAYNAEAAPDAMRRIAAALGRPEASAATAVFDLAVSCGAPTSLAAIGMQESDLDRACDLALQNQYANPRALERQAVRGLLDDAFHGRRPT
ncbi:MAG: maleylacetate reductase [Comamonadaceae bacterium]|nr:MAG: maleylacetate reductase [Comamonadaceae bacterium]